MNRKICLNHRQFFFVLFFCSSAAFSQDTLAPAAPKEPVRLSYTKESEADFNVNSEEGIDSSLSHFHRRRGYLYDITLERNIFLEEDEIPSRHSVVKFNDDITQPYKFSYRTLRYYNLNRRFTEMTYLFGAKKEQLINIVYTQNLMKGWSVGLDFRRTGAEGFFQRQQFYQSSFDVFTRYESPKGRYNLFAYYLRNRVEQEENGGIKEFNPDENTVAQPTYLTTASNSQTDKELLVRQFFGIGSKKSSDSTVAKSPLSFVGHSVTYATKGLMYVDSPSDSFYANNFYDSTATSDSTWYQRWNNKIFLQRSDSSGESPFLNSFLALGYEHFSFKNEPSQFEEEGRLNIRDNVYLELSADIMFPKKILLSGYTRWIITGDYSREAGNPDGGQDDMLLYAKVSKPIFKDKLKIFAEGHWEVRHPDISDIRKYSNHFRWYNEFDQVQSLALKAGIATTDNKFLLSGSYTGIDDMIYYDSIATPRQFGETINIIKLKLQKNFYWRDWLFENRIEYQKVNNEDVIHHPEFMTGHTLGFETFIFKNALLGRVGVDVRYVSSYLADRYMPALQEFYLQHTEETAGYVLADFFITFKVKTARFFVKMENIFSGVYPEPKFSRPDYPLTPRALRFGLQIRFFD